MKLFLNPTLKKGLVTSALIAFLLVCFSCRKEKNEVIRIATASNMQFAIQEICNSFTEQTGIECEIILGSSGKHTAQILQGAPFDIFLSADMKYPQKIFEESLAEKSPKVYALGQLILVTASAEKPYLSILTVDSIQNIAIANPKIAPYGKATLEFLQNSGMYDTIQSKLVYGENVSQVNQFVLSGVASVGITSQSVVYSGTAINNLQYITIPKQLYRPIKQGALLLKRNNEHQDESTQFYHFLFSVQSQKILKDFGYLIPE